MNVDIWELSWKDQTCEGVEDPCGVWEMSGRFPFLQEHKTGKRFSIFFVGCHNHTGWIEFLKASGTLPSDLGWQEKVSAWGWGLKSAKENRKCCIFIIWWYLGDFFCIYYRYRCSQVCKAELRSSVWIPAGPSVAQECTWLPSAHLCASAGLGVCLVVCFEVFWGFFVVFFEVFCVFSSCKAKVGSRTMEWRDGLEDVGRVLPTFLDFFS